MTIDITFSDGSMFTPIFDESVESITPDFEESIMSITPDFGEVSVIMDYDWYTGDYEATPTVSQQVFLTNLKAMSDDFTVKGIEKQETLNPQGGYTVNIGG